MSVTPAAQDYLAAVRGALVEELGDLLVGCYVYGSVLTTEFVPGRSDLDLVTVTRSWMPAATEVALTERLRGLPRPAALKGLDIWFLPLAASTRPGQAPRHQVRMLTSLDLVDRDDRARPGDPRLAMLLAICRNHSEAVVGPQPARVIGRVPLAGVLLGMLADLGSHAPPHYRVLNACRDLHFLVEGRMCSKQQGAIWARGRLGPPGLLEAAAAWQRHGPRPGADTALDADQVHALVTSVEDLLLDAVQLGQVPAGCRQWLERDATPEVGPKVTCVMPTYNRRHFVERSIGLFLAQDYPHRELVVVDDGEDDVSDLVRPHADVHHLRLPRRTTIGEKRNLVARDTEGEVLVQWDDDDWYGPARLARQVGPVLSGRADLTAVHKSWLVDLDSGRFFRPRLVPRRVSDTLALGTLALTTDLWRRSHRYPHASKREDLTMFLRATDLGAGVEGVANDGIYVYVRHGANSWRFQRGPLDHRWWAESPPPAFLSPDDLRHHFTWPRPGPLRTG